MKEDVLEQIVDDYLKFHGFFTAHNIPFGPRKGDRGYDAQQDSVRSDIDVIAIHPRHRGLNRVWVVNCKAWQGGFDATAQLARLRGKIADTKSETWRRFRELWKPKWSKAFLREVEERTGATKFTYRLAVTHLRGDYEAWAQDRTIKNNLPDCDIGFLTLEQMWQEVLADKSRRPAPSEIGRLAQLLKAAELTAPQRVNPD